MSKTDNFTALWWLLKALSEYPIRCQKNDSAEWWEYLTVVRQGIQFAIEVSKEHSRAFDELALLMHRVGAKLNVDAVNPAMKEICILRTLLAIDDGSAARDTKSDTPKKSVKNTRKRSMNTRAIDCCRRYKADNLNFPMKTIVSDYVAEHGGSFDSIMRVLNDNPEQWKKDNKKAT
jgi:hypothetical protein